MCDLTISGVELHPGAVADEDSPDWQEIAPELAREPLLLQLTPHSGADSVVLPATISGHIPAGTYYQLRLRLANPESLQSTQLASKNSCGAAGAGCLFTANGDLHALRSPDGSRYLRLVTTSPIDVRAGQQNFLRIELTPEWLLQKSSTGSLDVAPLLRGRILNDAAPPAGSL